MNRPPPRLRVARVEIAAPVAAAVAVGAAYALHDRFSFRPVAFVLTVVGCVCAALGASALEAVFDHIEGAGLPPGHPGREGGPRALDEGVVGVRQAVLAGISGFAAAAICGAALVPLAGSGIVGLGVLGVGLALLYAAPPIALSRLAVGSAEAVVFVCAGLVPVLAGYYAQTSRLTIGSAVAAVPIGFWASAIVWCGHLARSPRDEALERPSPVNAWGEQGWRQACWAWIAAGAAAAAVAVGTGDYAPLCLASTAAFVWPAWLLSSVRVATAGQAAAISRAMRNAVTAAALVVALSLALSAAGFGR